MPSLNVFVKFENWKRTIKWPFTIYADLEMLLIKNKNKTIKKVNQHNFMNFCCYVKPFENIQFEI